MTRIGIIADTHDYIDDAIFTHFDKCDEVWHAGDFGTSEVSDRLKAFKPLRGVYGNIDGYDIREEFPEKNIFSCEGVNVFMTHIGGHPGKYAPCIKNEIIASHAKLFICGHSHILKVIYDDKIGCLHINPGAAGKSGWHKVRTIVRLVIDGDTMKQCEVVELGSR